MAKRKKGIKTKLKEKLDKLVKTQVRQRDKNICQRCNKRVEGANCHVSHVIAVSQGGRFQFDPLNLKVLCFHRHTNWWHKNPVEAGEWFKQRFPERYDYLYIQHNHADRLKKWKTWELEEEIEKYK